MHVKNAVLTFVAMGGFAVPVIFETPAAGNPSTNAQAQTALANAAPDPRKPGKEA